MLDGSPFMILHSLLRKLLAQTINFHRFLYSSTITLKSIHDYPSNFVIAHIRNPFCFYTNPSSRRYKRASNYIIYIFCVQSHMSGNTRTVHVKDGDFLRKAWTFSGGRVSREKTHGETVYDKKIFTLFNDNCKNSVNSLWNSRHI